MFRFVLLTCIAVLFTSIQTKEQNEFSYKDFCQYYGVKDSTDDSKAILIEFWASWCQPCRKINGEISELHNEYRNQSMTIGNGMKVIFVGLDTDSIRWSKAIRNDRIQWAEHFRDTAKFNSSFLMKNRISYLPMNVLLDSSGQVVSQGLYGKALRDKLDGFKTK